METLMRLFARVSVADAHFREEKTLPFLDSPLMLEGTLSYRAPDYLKKQVLLPVPSVFEISGDRLFLQTEQEMRTLSLDSHPLLRAFAESYRAILAGDQAALEHYYDVSISGSANSWSLELTPKDLSVRKRVKSIKVTGYDHHLESVETIETSGDRSVMTILSDE